MLCWFLFLATFPGWLLFFAWPAYRHWQTQLWLCLRGQDRPTPCAIGLNDQFKNQLTSRFIFSAPTLAKFLEITVDILAFLGLVIILATLSTSLWWLASTLI
jgi:hypothetical protein